MSESKRVKILGIEVVHCSGNETVKEHYCASAENFLKLYNLMQTVKSLAGVEGLLFLENIPVEYNPNLDFEEIEDEPKKIPYEPCHRPCGSGIGPCKECSIEDKCEELTEEKRRKRQEENK